MIILTTVPALIVIIYTFVLVRITVGWFSYQSLKQADHPPSTKVSLIIPMRNEQASIVNLLEDIDRQDYPRELLEVIVVDDHSDDGSIDKVMSFVMPGKHPVKLIELKDSGRSGKKAAIEEGVDQSTGELILTTDADCSVGVSWLRTIVQCYEQDHPEMILAPVNLKGRKGIFSKLQEVEWVSLMAVTAGSAENGKPLMANGANLAYRKQAFVECGRYSGGSGYASGDDMFLLASVKQRFGQGSVRYLKEQDAVVFTNTAVNWHTFVQQRIRWVSKSRGYTDLTLIYTSFSVFLMNLLLITLLCAGAISTRILFLAGLVYVLKILIELPLMYSASKFFKKSKLFWIFPLMQPINALYTVLIGVAGNFRGFEWKGRKYNL
jgi:cellulose synthase/poly-beta-1,6-N-acetylglucosamine synthase-like glycosyltransferase